jgi:ketosteroid isomerase-like protein
VSAAGAKAVVQRFFDAWNSGDTAAFDDLVDETFEEPWAPSPGFARGPAGARASYAAALGRNSALRFEIEDIVGDDHAVAVRTVLRYTTRATGESGRMVGMNFFHLANGKLSREWYVYTKVS